MDTMDDLEQIGSRLRNWGRWGEKDELGTLNFITEDTIREAATLAKRGAVFPLGVDFGSTGPQGLIEYRYNPIHVMTVDGGDANSMLQYGPDWFQNSVAQVLSSHFPGKFRFNDDMIIMPLQAATQWDALAHVYYDDQLYNGFPAASVTSMGARHCSIDKVDVKGITSRGVLLDAVNYRGADRYLPLGAPIMPEELDAIAQSQGVEIRSGDLIVIHTGWWGEYAQARDRTLQASGIHWTCAEWLYEHEIAAIAADNLMVEDTEIAVENALCPMHMLCLRDMGLMLGEFWDTSKLAADCAADGVYEFQLVAPPLRVIGAVGSPVNPIAIK